MPDVRWRYRSAAAALLVLASASLAQAQIYAWRDERAGILVLSDRPRPDGGQVATYAVGGGRAPRVTRPADRRSAPFDALINTHAQRSGLAPDLVRAVIQVESGFNPSAVSPKGAMGLMQLMPATAEALGVSDPFDAEQNIRGGTAYLRRLLDRYDQDVTLALAAYNAGPGAVDRAGQQVPPYRETQAYVQRITGTRGRRTVTVDRSVIYKWVELVDGRPIPRYSNKPPDRGPYEVVRR